uniref:Uncharacterized protein LOC105646684 isoform X2 n=1 Tax=Rhizophora mucronata TaxID=61149 RepID=A0A2P2JGC9_RHIMU
MRIIVVLRGMLTAGEWSVS